MFLKYKNMRLWRSIRIGLRQIKLKCLAVFTKQPGTASKPNFKQSPEIYFRKYHLRKSCIGKSNLKIATL